MRLRRVILTCLLLLHGSVSFFHTARSSTGVIRWTSVGDNQSCDLPSLTVVQLKALCRERQIPVSGTKAVLIERLSQCESKAASLQLQIPSSAPTKDSSQQHHGNSTTSHASAGKSSYSKQTKEAQLLFLSCRSAKDIETVLRRELERRGRYLAHADTSAASMPPRLLLGPCYAAAFHALKQKCGKSSNDPEAIRLAKQWLKEMSLRREQRFQVSEEWLPDGRIYRNAMDFFGAVGRWQDVEQLLDCLLAEYEESRKHRERNGRLSPLYRPPMANRLHLNSMVAAYARGGQIERARRLVGKPVHDKREVSTFSQEIRFLGRDLKPGTDFSLAEELVATTSHSPSPSSSSSLSYPDIVTFNCLLNGLDWRAAAIVLTEEMPACYLVPDVVSFNTAITKCVKARKPQKALQLFNLMTTGTYPGSSGNEDALIGSAPIAKPNDVTMTQVISAHGQLGDWRSALRLVEKEMPAMWGLHPTVFSLNTCMSVCGQCGEWRKVEELFDRFVRKGTTAERNVEREGGGKSDDAKEGLIEPQVATYNILISAAAKAGNWRRAEKLLDEMCSGRGDARDDSFSGRNGRRRGASTSKWKKRSTKALAPDARTYSAVMSAYGSAGEKGRALALVEKMEELEQQQQQHSGRRKGFTAKKNRLVSRFSYNAAINACDKAHDWESAVQLLRRMQQKHRNEQAISSARDSSNDDNSVSPDLVSYNAAISACARCGRLEDAMLLFREMQKESDGREPRGGKIEPSRITYVLRNRQ